MPLRRLMSTLGLTRRQNQTATRSQSESRYQCEPLEQRNYLYTVSGTGSFEFLDARDQTIRVEYNNITAEFIFANFSPTRNRWVPTGFVLPGTELPEGQVAPDLFNIWVVQAGENSHISIALVPEPDPEDPQPRFMDPFGGSVSLTVVPGPDGPESLTFGAGAAYIGARTEDIEETDANEEDMPVTRMRFTSGLGIIGPTPNGWLSSGLIVEPGQDLNRFLLGGTITGEVSIGGSMELFYAGAVLTGDANHDGFSDFPGQPQGAPQVPGNFRVRGDLRNMMVYAEIGSSDIPETAQGFLSPDYVSGFDMEVGGSVGQIRSMTADYLGSVRVQNSSTAPRLRGTTFEFERRHEEEFTVGSDFALGLLGDLDPVFDNDTFDTAQYLPIYNHSRLGPGSVQVRGEVQNTPLINDAVDYYGVGLLAGQTITLRVISDLGLVTVGVFDPDARLIATDQGDGNLTVNQPFRFTADRPGVYRFAVALEADPDFGGGEFSPATTYTAGYLLQITGVGDVALGALAVGDDSLDPLGTRNVLVDVGDIGALVAVGQIYSSSYSPTATVPRGSLRAMVAETLGNVHPSTGQIVAGPDISVAGSVGLVRTTGLADFNTTADPFLGTVQAIGGHYQWVDVGETLVTMMIANGSIGVVRAGDMTVENFQSWFEVDANQDGVGGIIDLIDVTGDFGTLAGGGPAIINNGGNVRYLRVGGQVFRDPFFGGGSGDEAVTYDPAEDVDLVDDSGTQVNLAPIPLRRVINFETGQVTFVNPGTLTITAYGIRNRPDMPGGGVAIINVTSTRGVQFEGGAVRGGAAEIATISANEQILIDGSATLDVLEIVGADDATFSEISNGSNGEMAAVVADEITLLSGRTLGLAKNHTRAAVELRVADVPTVEGAPLANTNTGIFVTGLLTEARARQGIGNVQAGDIDTLTANADGRFESGVYEGINGRIFSVLDIASVNIGEGILPTGTGEVYYSGLFATGRIIEVENQGLGSDIMGDIVSLGENRLLRQGAIETISLGDGSIINADIMVVSDFLMAREYASGRTLPGDTNSITDPIFEIGQIGVSGRGGIIGSLILAFDVGDVVVENGFGIIQSTIGVVGNGQVGNVVADGYGVRYSGISGGQRTNAVSARGRGNTIAATAWTPTVRWTESERFHPYSGGLLNVLNDLHENLGTSVAVPTRKGITDTGQIAGSTILSGRDINLVEAQQIKSSTVRAANLVNRILVRDTINGLSTTTGRLNRVIVQNDLLASTVVVAGPIGTIQLGRTFGENAAVRATGPEGKINSFATGLDFRGVLTSTGRINQVLVGRHMKGAARLRYGLDNIDARSDLGLLLVNGHIFAPVAIDVDGNIEALVLGGDLKEGAQIRTDAILSQVIKGSVFGDVIFD